jgi:hypothetical protein
VESKWSVSETYPNSWNRVRASSKLRRVGAPWGTGLRGF